VQTCVTESDIEMVQMVQALMDLFVVEVIG